MSEYPKRERFYSHRFCRLLTKCCAAQEIGTEACWMLTVIVHQEDAKKYKGPVSYWNEQLMPLCGFGGRTRLVLARSKAIEAGWLHYEAGGKGRPGLYWTLIPDQYADIPDSPMDEESDQFCRTEIGRQIGRQLECRPETGRKLGRQTDGNQDGKPAPSLPYPIPNTSCPGNLRDDETQKAKTKYSEADRVLADWFWSQIVAMQPDRKPPKIDQWSNTFRLMRERDGRTDQQIRDLFQRVGRDEFWRVNILSPEKLRQKWDDLALKLGRNGNGKPSAARAPVSDEDPDIRRTREILADVNGVAS